MSNLKVQIKSLAHRAPVKQSKIVTIAVFVLVGLLLLPILIVVLLIVGLFRLFKGKAEPFSSDHWNSIDTYSDLKVSYRWLPKEEIPHHLAVFAQDEVITVFRTDPILPFFKGYFTTFKVERTDGIFVQKIEMDESHRTIESMPLYFFDYQARDVQLIHDLKGYELDTKGNPDDFLLIASSDKGDLEIHLTR